MLRGRFAAEQDRFLFKAVFREDRLHLSRADESKIGVGVGLPTSLDFFISVQNSLRGREQRFMLINRSADFFDKVGEVGLLGEGGKLGGVIEAHVKQALDAVSFQRAEELSGAFLGKTDAVDLH